MGGISASPPGWGRVPLWSVIRRTDRTGFPDEELLSVYRDHGVVPKSSRDDNFNKPGEDLAAYRLVEPGDLVLNKMKTWQGSLAVSMFRGIVSPAYYVCSVRSGVDPRYLHYLLRSKPLIAQYAALSKGIRPNQWDLPYDEFKGIEILLPPLDVQRRIADFLDDQVARMDRLDNLRAQQAGIAERFLASAIEDAVNSMSAVLPLRRVVSRWIDYRGATPEKTDEGVPLVTAGNIRDGAITFEALQEFIAPEDYATWMRRGLPEVGDLLLTTEAPMGQVAQVEDASVALAQRVILLRADILVVQPRWLYWSLRSPSFQLELLKNATGTTALGIKAARLRGLGVTVGDFREQDRMAARLDAWQENVLGLRAASRRARTLIRERKRSLVTAAVTGEFDVTAASSRAADAALSGVGGVG